MEKLLRKHLYGAKCVLIFLLFSFLVSPLFSSDKTDAVDMLFARWDRPDSPWAAIAIIKEGHILYEQGGIQGFLLGTGRVRNMKFIKK